MAERADRYWDYTDAAWVPSPPQPASVPEPPQQRTAVETEPEADVRSG